MTSALDDQRAMDGGPVPGHSLFTGCLIEAIRGGLAAATGQRVVTGSEIGYYVRRCVSEYPGSSQTPDFGALELDDRGELLVTLAGADEAPAAEDAIAEPLCLGDQELRKGPPLAAHRLGGGSAPFRTSPERQDCAGKSPRSKRNTERTAPRSRPVIGRPQLSQGPRRGTP